MITTPAEQVSATVTTTESVQTESKEQSEFEESAPADKKDNKFALKIVGGVAVAIGAAVGAKITNKKKRKK